MKVTRRTILAVALVTAVPLLHGCATKIKASSLTNPAPMHAFSNYSRIEVKPVMFAAGYKGNDAALSKIAANFTKELAPSLAKWNGVPRNGTTLTVEPVVEQISFKSSTKRVFLGPLAGSSGVLMRVTYRDQNGKVIAEPQFFQRAGAMSGGFTLGVQDNLMLLRVAKLASSYTIGNYERAIGGPTGADDGAVAAN